MAATLQRLHGPRLWIADGNHPTVEGTYLAACVFYTAIYRESAEGLPTAPDCRARVRRRCRRSPPPSCWQEPARWGGLSSAARACFCGPRPRSDTRRQPAEDDGRIDRAVLGLLLDPELQRPWSQDEIAREIGDEIEPVDSLTRLHGAALIPGLDGFVCASRAAIKAHEIWQRLEGSGPQPLHPDRSVELSKTGCDRYASGSRG